MGDLDRRKHDVDIIEHVLGGIRDRGRDERRTRVVDLTVDSADDSSHSMLEVTIGIDDGASDRRRRGSRR